MSLSWHLITVEDSLTNLIMLNKNNEQRVHANSSFVLNHEINEQFELILPELMSIMDEPFEATDFESDDYFMELELEFDE